MSNKNIRKLKNDGYYIPRGDLYHYKEPTSEKIKKFVIGIIVFIALAYLLYYASGGLL